MCPLRLAAAAAATASHFAAPRYQPAACAFCRCSCGVRFRPSNDGRSPLTTRRALATAAKAPSTRLAEKRARGLSPAEAEASRKRKEFDGQRLYRMLKKIVPDPEAWNNFVVDFGESPTLPGKRYVVASKRLIALLNQYKLNPKYSSTVCFLLLHSTAEQDKEIGRKLIFTLSAAGDRDATKRLLCDEFLTSQRTNNRRRLENPQLADARAQLQEWVRDAEGNPSPAVLEGKILHFLGDETRAIELWNSAVKDAVELSEQEALMRQQGRRKELENRVVTRARDRLELSTPWIELTLAHYQRFERFQGQGNYKAALVELEKSREAMKIGCQQDDPTSHYHAAAFFYRPDQLDENGKEKGYSSHWLYHMTKAAATGHPKAAHAMGVYYAETAWKFIEDEPPDHIKPTPFDSYPATMTSPITKFLRALGLSKPPTDDPVNDIFHSAVFPSTPEQRRQLALRWLQCAGEMTYAPSYLYAARVLLRKTMWSDAAVPSAALTLSDARYTYPSKAAFEAGSKDHNMLPASPATEIPAPPHLHDRDLAYKYISNVCRALSACSLRQMRLKRLGELVRQRKLGDVGELDSYEPYRYSDVDDKEMQEQGISPEAAKWLRQDDVREMYDNDAENSEMAQQAMEICDEQGWTVYDGDGGLLYRPGLRKMAPVPASAVPW